MKKSIVSLLTLTLSFLTPILLTSCNDEPDGKAEDTIKLSKSRVLFNSEASSTTITTASLYWWINDIRVDNHSIDRDTMEALSEKKVFEYRGDWFVIKRDSFDINISVDKNEAKSFRILGIDLQAGNWFGSRIKIEQDGAGL